MTEVRDSAEAAARERNWKAARAEVLELMEREGRWPLSPAQWDYVKEANRIYPEPMEIEFPALSAPQLAYFQKTTAMHPIYKTEEDYEFLRRNRFPKGINWKKFFKEVNSRTARVRDRAVLPPAKRLRRGLIAGLIFFPLGFIFGLLLLVWAWSLSYPALYWPPGWPTTGMPWVDRILVSIAGGLLLFALPAASGTAMQSPEVAATVDIELPQQVRVWRAASLPLVLLCHNFCCGYGVVRAPQQGHRGRVFASALIKRTRTVVIESAMWRSGRKGGSSGSITVG